MNQISIKAKILSLIFVVGIVPALLLAFFAPNRTKQLGSDILAMEAKFISELLSDNLALGMQTVILDDGAALQQTLDAVENQNDSEYASITSVKVFNAELQLVKGLNAPEQEARFEPADDDDIQFIETPQELISFSPMHNASQDIEGYIEINFSKQYLNHKSAANSRFSVLLSIALLSASLGFGYIVVNGITKSLKDLSESAKKIARGNVNVQVSQNSKDEVGSLADSFREIVKSQKSKAETAEQIANGNLEVEVAIVSEEDVLGKAMQTVKQSLTTMKTDLEMVIDEQTSGNMDARCHPDTVQGVYKDLLKGINSAFDAFTAPVLEAIGIMDDYAKGNLSRQLRDLPGKQIVLTRGLNGIRTNVKALIDEGLMLANAAADGKLSVRGDIKKFEGDYRTIIHGLNDTINNLLQPINEAIRCLEATSKGDLTVSMQGDYKGDDAKMKIALNSTMEALNNILGQVNSSVKQVSTGARQMTDASNNLSESATKQAAALQEISSSMNEIGAHTKKNAENATQANKLSGNALSNAEEGNKQMQRMLQAMDEINHSSDAISKIIKAIDEIAFQTNLLALNAAVEAARAGVHGKGFAVVAEEVRNLAQRSAKAAKETTDLIQDSIKKVDNGMNLANLTASALNEIVEATNKATELVGTIASASKDQAQGIDKLTLALGNVDQMTQSYTASAEETASSAEELASQSAKLRQMLNQFTIKNSQHNRYDVTVVDKENADVFF